MSPFRIGSRVRLTARIFGVDEARQEPIGTIAEVVEIEIDRDGSVQAVWARFPSGQTWWLCTPECVMSHEAVNCELVPVTYQLWRRGKRALTL